MPSFSGKEEGKEERKKKKPEREVSVILTCLIATVSPILAEADTNLNYFFKAQHPADLFYKGAFKTIHNELKLFISENTEDFRGGTLLREMDLFVMLVYQAQHLVFSASKSFTLLSV